MPAFMDTFKSVMIMFNVRQDADTLAAEYFKVLKPFPIRLVSEGGDKCKASLKRFPKAAEWKENIPREVGPGLSEMNSFEAADYREAESCFYEMPPCGCDLCGKAGVSHRPIRYVPDADEPKFRLGEVVVVRGHWAHGVELKRWYAAKDAFWSKVRATVGRSGRHAKGFELLGRPDNREPGQEG